MTSKLQTVKPRLREIGSIVEEQLRAGKAGRTLQQKREANGRTLALNGSAWRTLRASVLREHPLCEHCLDDGTTELATDVDHRDNDPTNNHRDNLSALCHACHARKTNADMGRRVAYGCDAHGRPLDPNHHWNRDLGALLQKSPGTDEREPTGYPFVSANREDQP